MLLTPITITCVFTLGVVVGSLLDHARHKRASNNGQRKLRRASTQTASSNGDGEPHWAMKALVVVRDPEILNTFCQLFEAFHIETHRCLQESNAIQRLSSEKFETLVLDADNIEAAAEILKVKAAPRNRHLVVVAVASDDRARETASLLDPAFTIERPLAASRLRDLVAKVHGRMLRERQAYFRVAVQLPVTIRRRSGELLQFATLNLSQSGMAITGPHLLLVGEQLSLGFAIPNSDMFVSAEGTLVWEDGNGRAGIQFECSSSSVKVRYFDWLHDQFFVRFGVAGVESRIAWPSRLPQ